MVIDAVIDGFLGCRIIHGLFYIPPCSYFYSTFTGLHIITELLIEIGPVKIMNKSYQ